jgi:hypothetical protein
MEGRRQVEFSIICNNNEVLILIVGIYMECWHDS